MGQVADDAPYQPAKEKDIKPFRRNVAYHQMNEVPIRLVIADLDFIKNNKKWGFYLISGFREISKDDFEVIRLAMK